MAYVCNRSVSLLEMCVQCEENPYFVQTGYIPAGCLWTLGLIINKFIIKVTRFIESVHMKVIKSIKIIPSPAVQVDLFQGIHLPK